MVLDFCLSRGTPAIRPHALHRLFWTQPTVSCSTLLRLLTDPSAPSAARLVAQPAVKWPRR